MYPYIAITRYSTLIKLNPAGKNPPEIPSRVLTSPDTSPLVIDSYMCSVSSRDETAEAAHLLATVAPFLVEIVKLRP